MIPPVDQPKGELSEARVREILDGCDGVTPGPWAVNPFRARVDAFDILDPDGGTPVCQMLWPTELRSETETNANASHIAQLDPDTTRALCNLALNALATKQVGAWTPEKYAEQLACAIRERCYPEVPQFEPMTGDIMGLLSQIDNMTTGMVRSTAIPAAGVGEVVSLSDLGRANSSIQAKFDGKEITPPPAGELAGWTSDWVPAALREGREVNVLLTPKRDKQHVTPLYLAASPAVTERVQALEDIREHIVLAIAFLGRDAGSDRMERTLPQVIDGLVKADAAIRALKTKPRPLSGEEFKDALAAALYDAIERHPEYARGQVNGVMASDLAEAVLRAVDNAGYAFHFKFPGTAQIDRASLEDTKP